MINSYPSSRNFISLRGREKLETPVVSGQRHPNWRHGKNQEYRNKLLKNGTTPVCNKCDLKDKRVLVVYHKDKNRRNNKIENLVWLCLNCHFLVHHHTK